MADTALTPAQLAAFDQKLEKGISVNLAIAAQFDDVALPEAMASMCKGHAETTTEMLGLEGAIENLAMQVAGLSLRLRRLMLERDKAGA